MTTLSYPCYDTMFESTTGVLKVIQRDNNFTETVSGSVTGKYEYGDKGLRVNAKATAQATIH